MKSDDLRPAGRPLNIKGAYAAREVLEEFQRNEPLRRVLAQILPKTPTWVEPELVVRKGRRNLANNNWGGGVLLTGGRAPKAGPASTVDGYATNFNGQEHVVFVGADAHIHELAYIAAQWVFRDLTALTTAPLAAAGSSIAGYSSEFNSQQHVIYLGSDGHVHELYYDNAWQHTDLTLVAGAAGSLPAPGSALAGYVTGFNEQQHVIYVGADQHVHELFYDGGWRHTDLTVAAGAFDGLPRAGSPLAGYATEFNDQHHVIYLDAHGLVHELMYDNAWHHANLTFAAGAANSPAGPASMLAGYPTGFNGQQHVIYVGFDAHVHELMYDNAWRHADLSVMAGATATLPVAGSALDGYATPFNSQQHVVYIGTDSHVHELMYDDAWHENDLTNAAGGPPNARPGSPLAGYATAYDSQQHVIFIDPGNDVEELYYDGSWQANDLRLAAVSAVQVVPWITALGSWTIPSVSQSNMPPGTSGGWESSSWVGIDGQLSNDVLQAGVRQRVDGDGNASYYAWIEWYAPEQPDSPDYIHETEVASLPVSPGQKMFCLARYVDNQTRGSLLLMNQDTGLFTSVTLDPPPGAAFLGNTIEWIMEAPDSGPPDTSLPRFDRIVFTPASGVDLAGSNGDPSTANVSTIMREGIALTTTTLAVNTVTIDFLPWHADDPTGLSGAPNAAGATALDGYSTAFNEQQHIVYLATDGHVHELLFEGGWSQNDLSVNAGALGALPAAGSSIAGYSSEFNSQQHVIYLGSDGHVHELYYDNAWQHTDLTLVAGAAGSLPAPGSALAGYVTGFNEQQHVVYVGADQHVHELFYDGGWRHTDLTVAAGAFDGLPRAGSPLAGYATEFNDQHHVIYLDAHGLVHELMYDNAWHHANLTFAAGAANSPAGPASMLAGYPTGFNGQQHVIYVGFDAHVHELMYDNAWRHADLSVMAGATATLPVAGSALDGYATPFNSQQHVVYIGTDSHVHELMYDDAWHENDLTNQSAAFPIRAGTPLAGYATPFNSQEHVAYIGADNHVREAWY